MTYTMRQRVIRRMPHWLRHRLGYCTEVMVNGVHAWSMFTAHTIQNFNAPLAIQFLTKVGERLDALGDNPSEADTILAMREIIRDGQAAISLVERDLAIETLEDVLGVKVERI